MLTNSPGSLEMGLGIALPFGLPGLGCLTGREDKEYRDGGEGRGTEHFVDLLVPGLC